MENVLIKEKGGQHFDEMNLIEFPMGILAERVPIDSNTGFEHTQLRFARPVEESGEQREQVWIVTGDPNYGGLPRGYDLDVLTALLTLWSRGNFQSQLISVGSAYHLLKLTGRDITTRNYRRFNRALDRLFGVSIQTEYAIYDPSERRRWPVFKFRVLNSVRLRSNDPESMPRGYVRLDADLQLLFQRGYLKLTDMERYWRLPTPHSRRMFQYLDKHRSRALRERDGCFVIGIYLLAKKLGTHDQTLRSYRPAKLRGILETHLEVLKEDDYLARYEFKRERGRQREEFKHKVVVTYARPADTPEPLPEKEADAVEQLGIELRDALSRRYHETVVRELGADRALSLMRAVLARAEADPKTHRGKLFTYLAQQERGRG